MRRHTLKPLVALCLFSLAFALRIAFAIQWQSTPYGDAPLLDAQLYDQWAWNLANGKAPAHAFYQSPLYPYLLSLVYRIAGRSYFAASLLNGLLDSGTVVLLALIAWRLFGRGAAIVTGLLAALYAPTIFYAAPPMKEPLALFLLALFLFWALRALRENGLGDYALCGLAFGLATLARGNLLLLAPLVPVFACRHYGRGGMKGAALFSCAVLLALAPAAWRNYESAHDFVPISYAGGFNLYIGHSPYANGTNAYPPEISTGPEQERLDTTWIAEQAAGKKLRPSEISAFWRDKAADFALHNPAREAGLLARKFYAFWNGADSFDNYDVAFVKRHFPSLLNAPLAGFALVSALAAFAFFAGAARGREGAFLIACAGIYMFSVLIFYVTDRYRLPVIVFLLPLAGAAAPRAAALIEDKQSGKLCAAAAGALLFLALALSPPLDAADLAAFDWGTLTAVYADKGEDENSLDAFRTSTALSLQGAGVQAYIRAAGVYEKLGQSGEAEKLVAQAVEVFPQDGVALYNLGRRQAMRGAIDEALATMRKAQQLDPSYTLTYFALARLYAKKNDQTRAREAVRQGLAIDPEDARLLSLAEKAQGW